MKKLIFILFISFGIISCNGNSPEKITEKFVTAMSQNEFRKAQDFVDDFSKNHINQIIKAVESYDLPPQKSPKINFKLLKIKEITPDSVFVYYKLSDTLSEQHLNVKKINGFWKVSLEHTLQETTNHHHNCNH